MMDAKLETLLKVNETRNFTRAAKLLSLTQPAVSQHIRQLEHDLKVSLFIRGEGALKLTPEGEIAVKYARRIENLYQNLEQALQDEKKTSPGSPSASLTPQRAISLWRSLPNTAALPRTAR